MVGFFLCALALISINEPDSYSEAISVWCNDWQMSKLTTWPVEFSGPGNYGSDTILRATDYEKRREYINIDFFFNDP